MKNEHIIKELSVNANNEAKIKLGNEEKEEKGHMADEENNSNLIECTNEESTISINNTFTSTLEIRNHTDEPDLQQKVKSYDTSKEVNNYEDIEKEIIVKEITVKEKETKENEDQDKIVKENDDPEKEVKENDDTERKLKEKGVKENEDQEKEKYEKEEKEEPVGKTEEYLNTVPPIDEKPSTEQNSPKLMKKGSMNFDLMDDNIFNIIINVDADNVKKNKVNVASKEKEKKAKNSSLGTRQKSKEFKKKNKEKNNNSGYGNTEDDGNSSSTSSCSSTGEVNKILKISLNDKIEKKNRSSYILQHKQRIKQANKEKTHTKQKRNESQLNHINIDKHSRGRVRRVNAAAIMLEKFKQPNSDDENSDYSDGYTSSEFLEDVNVFQ